MLRRLLNIACIVCLVLCVALMEMWVRSYWRGDSISVPCKFNSVDVFSVCGVVGYGAWTGQQYTYDSWTARSYPADNHTPFPKPLFLGFYFFAATYFNEVLVPYWFLVLASGSLAMLCRTSWPWRFVRRQLFFPFVEK